MVIRLFFDSIFENSNENVHCVTCGIVSMGALCAFAQHFWTFQNIFEISPELNGILLIKNDLFKSFTSLH